MVGDRYLFGMASKREMIAGFWRIYGITTLESMRELRVNPAITYITLTLLLFYLLKSIVDRRFHLIHYLRWEEDITQ